MHDRGTRADWLKLLLTTEPADRPRAESGVRDLYAACGLPHPRYLLWYESPFDAAWAVAMLVSGYDQVWRHIIDRESRVPAQRAKMQVAQADLCRRLAEADWAGACSAMGLPFEDLGPENPLNRIFENRCVIYGSADAVRKSGGFTAGDDDLYRAEHYLLGLVRGVLSSQESSRPAGLLIAGSVRGSYPYSMIAADESQGPALPPMLAALREVARSCGPWWAFEHAAILTDRPAEIYFNDRFLVHRSDGPAVVYRDGVTGWAWEGEAVPEESITHPEKIPAGILRQASPAFRRHVEQRTPRRQPRRPARGRANFLSRYRAGEHEQVWADLVALGPDVRKPRYRSEAIEVARETMRRVDANVRTVVNRLHMLQYRFKTKAMWLDEVAGILQSVEPHLSDHEVGAHVPPGPDAIRHIQDLEESAGPLPLSLRAFYEIVGEVSLIGVHDSISPEADPLVVFSLKALLEESRDEIAEEGLIAIAPDHYHKANISGGAPYEIALPDPRADAELLNEPHNLFFVDYLRLVFRHGGFPGYAGMDRDVPEEIAILSEGLERF